MILGSGIGSSQGSGGQVLQGPGSQGTTRGTRVGSGQVEQTSPRSGTSLVQLTGIESSQGSGDGSFQGPANQGSTGISSVKEPSEQTTRGSRINLSQGSRVGSADQEFSGSGNQGLTGVGSAQGSEEQNTQGPIIGLGQ